MSPICRKTAQVGSGCKNFNEADWITLEQEKAGRRRDIEPNGNRMLLIFIYELLSNEI